MLGSTVWPPAAIWVGRRCHSAQHGLFLHKLLPFGLGIYSAIWSELYFSSLVYQNILINPNNFRSY
jgi:hypothetical protein